MFLDQNYRVQTENLGDSATSQIQPEMLLMIGIKCRNMEYIRYEIKIFMQYPSRAFAE